MSTAKLAGCAQRQLAILGLGGNRRSLVAGIGMLMACAISCAIMSSSIWADDDAVLVIDETGFLKHQVQGVVRSGATIHWFRRERSRTARSESSLPSLFAPRSRVHRSRAVSSEGMDRRSRIAWKPHTCPPVSALRPNQQLATRMIAHAIAVSVPFKKWVAGDTVYGVGDIGTATTPGRQRLCTRGQQRSCISFLGQAAIRRRQELRTSARTRRSSDWKRLSAGAGTKGPRGCMIGAISELKPISRSKNLAAQIKVFGHAVC